MLAWSGSNFWVLSRSGAAPRVEKDRSGYSYVLDGWMDFGSKNKDLTGLGQPHRQPCQPCHPRQPRQRPHDRAQGLLVL